MCVLLLEYTTLLHYTVCLGKQFLQEALIIIWHQDMTRIYHDEIISSFCVVMKADVVLKEAEKTVHLFQT